MKGARILVGAATALVLAVVGWFYCWTAASDYPGTPIFGGPRTDYYNLLVHGFRDGQLAMKATPDPELGVDNSRVKSFLLDASFHHGRYYLYFGVTPALLLFLPWAVLTGSDLPEWLAAPLLAAAACLLAVAWLRLLRKEFFPRTGGGTWLAAVIAFGLGSGLPVVLRRSLFYEVAIVSGCMWTMASLLCLTLAAVRPGRSLRWLALGSSCAGLAAGSRPTLIPGALAALVLMAGWCWWVGEGGGVGRWTRAVRVMGVALGPVGLCLAGLGWYNWARFGNPFEFGLTYQLGSNANGFSFTLASLGRNLKVYYLTPPDVSWYFPFFAPGPKPLGSNPEQVHGQFFFLPLFVLLAAVSAWAAWRRRLPGRLAAIAATAGVWSGTSLVLVGMAPAHSNRYQLDFHPVVVVFVLGAVFACASAPRTRWLGRAAVAWLGLIAVYSVCISFQVHDFFQDSNPRAYAAIARVCDRLVWPLHRLTRPALSGVELRVVFDGAKPGAQEPLLVAGGGTDLDAILVRYTAPGRGQLVFEHQGLGTAAGPEFDLQPGRPRRLDVWLGTFCPPPWHPWYDHRPAGSTRQRTHVTVRLDGAVVLERDVPCFQASSSQIVLGRRGELLAGPERFSGRVELVGPLGFDRAWLEGLKQARGLVRLKVVLPRDRFGAIEPLLMTGALGRADLVAVHYLQDGLIQLMVLHEGEAKARTSPPIAVDYGQPHEFVIGLGSLPAMVPLPAGEAAAWAARGADVRLDGHTVMTERFTAHPTEPWEVYAGCTPWILWASRRMFGGQVLEVTRSEDGTARFAAALAAGRPLELTVIFPTDSVNTSEPLLTTGRIGRGDGLYVHYVGHDAVSFGFDHWGVGGPVSKPVPVDFDAEHHLVLSWGALLPPGSRGRERLRLVLDGQMVFDAPVEFYPALPSQVAVGLNPIGMSSSRPAFMGDFLALGPAAEGAQGVGGTGPPSRGITTL